MAARTRPSRSTTSTPSVISRITSRFSSAWWRAICRLPRAASSSRASRAASSPPSTATTKKPPPASPACTSATVGCLPASTASQVAPSSASVVAAAVAIASGRGVSSPAISIGSASSGSEFSPAPPDSTCSARKQAMSTPIVASQRGLRSRAIERGARALRKRGSSHRLMESAA